ncbi:Ankyrin repeat-containing protein BDA1 [Bienertia sinuspersici]
MDRRLVDVSQAGNIEAFYALLEDEPHILDFIDEAPHTRTPLHIAILARKSEFAKEIASLKPSFITKTDRYGYNPIHLAAEKGQVEMVRYLLEKLGPKKEVMIKGKENRTPLHFAVISGEVEVVKFLVKYYPRCIMDLTVRKETVLHLAVKNKQLGALLVLLEQLKLAIKVSHSEVGVINQLLNCKDEEGNSLLHLAVMMQQLQVLISYYS